MPGEEAAAREAAKATWMQGAHEEESAGTSPRGQQSSKASEEGSTREASTRVCFEASSEA